MLDFETYSSEIKNLGFAFKDDIFKKLDKYGQLLVSWNEKINLTAITEPNDVLIKHFIDSLWLAKKVPQVQTSSLIDVGTGAGFPSLPCKICFDDMDLTMIDSLNKRIDFLTEVCNTLEVNADCLHTRAEDLGKNPDYREAYDFATARAVAPLYMLAEYCLPFVKVGGYFVALKGYEVEEEVDSAKKAIKLLGGEIEEIFKYELSDSSKRSIIKIKKISQTSTKYPRNAAKMKKQPLNLIK